LASLLVVTQSTSLNSTIAVAGFTVTLGLALFSSVLALRVQPPRTIFTLLLGASLVNVILLMLGQSLATNS